MKLFEIESMSLAMVVPLADKFYGVRDDGKIYTYMRELREEEPMEVESMHDESEAGGSKL